MVEEDRRTGLKETDVRGKPPLPSARGFLPTYVPTELFAFSEGVKALKPCTMFPSTRFAAVVAIAKPLVFMAFRNSDVSLFDEKTFFRP